MTLWQLDDIEGEDLARKLAALIADFDVLPGDRLLELLRDALRLSAPALAVDPQQLRTQLVGLLSLDEPKIVTLRDACCDRARALWLRPLHPSLDAPGGMLVMTLVGHQGEVTSLAADAEQRLVFGC